MYDLIIMGGGVSGSVCALSALQHGVENILIIEKSKKPGGAISSKIDFVEENKVKTIFKELNLPVYNKTNKSYWISPRENILEYNSKISDLWIKRGPSEDSFDSLMLNRLAKKNVDILYGSKGTKIKKNEIKIISENGINKNRGKIFVDARGLNSQLSKNFGKVTPSLIIAFGFCGEGFDLEEDTPYIFFDQEFASGSYVLANVDSNDNLGYIILGTMGKNIYMEKNLQKFINSKDILRKGLKNTSIKNVIEGTLYATYELPNTFQSQNLLFTGDAALIMDPFLHYGIQPAVTSGFQAGKVVGEFLEDRTELSNYSSLIEENIMEEFQKNLIYRKIFDNLDNRDLDNIFSIMEKVKNSGFDIDDLLT